MDEVRRKLTTAEKAHLSNLWEDKDTLRSLGSALSHQQLILQHQSAMTTANFEQVMDLRGQVRALEWLVLFLQQNHKKVKESRQNAQQAADDSSYSQ